MRLTVAVIIGLATSVAARADTPAPLLPQVSRIVGDVYEGRGLELLTELSDRVGARVTGTKGYAAGVTWAMQALRAAGASDVHVEKVRLPASWERGGASGRLLGAAARPLSVESFGWAPSTPAGGITAPVVIVDNLDPAVWTAQTSKLKGAIVVITDRVTDRKTLPWRLRAVPAFARAGARAVVFGTSKLPNAVRGKVGLGATILPLPTVTIGLEDAAYITRHAADGLRMELVVTNKVGPAIDVDNVVGELRGADPSAGWLIVSAHLDSWDGGTGAQDNGSGVVTVIETARALAAVGGLKRTVRFALWAGEEQSLVGSRGYVAAHAAELPSCVAMLNTDGGAGHVIGWSTVGRDDVRAAIAPISAAYLRGLGGADVSTEYLGGSDFDAFLLAGVPVLDLNTEEAPYLAIHHKVGDTVDKVDAHAFASGVAVFAATTYVLAMSSTRLGPQLGHDAIDAHLARIGQADIVRELGFWK